MEIKQATHQLPSNTSNGCSSSSLARLHNMTQEGFTFLRSEKTICVFRFNLDISFYVFFHITIYIEK